LSIFSDSIKLVDLPKYEDHRGFLTSFWTPEIGEFQEDRCSVSNRNVLRGLHGDAVTDKLIVVLSGEVEFFATPYLKDNPNFGEKTFITLSGKTPQAIYLPKGFVNGHLCLSEECVFFYKWSHYYNGVDAQVSVSYDDAYLNIPWSISSPVLSDRDKHTSTSFEDLVHGKN
tara:strand:- start:2767 stop:3279 length:513 start_codon:yes stop_codon:yes gene_type:complete